MAWWQIVLIILVSIIVGFFLGSTLSKLILRLIQKRNNFSDPNYKLELIKSKGWGQFTWDRLLTTTLVLIILGTLGILGYVITNPNAGETFTEFYILGQGGKAADYPQVLTSGREGRVTIGIINHERVDVSYRIAVVINGKGNNEELTVNLAHEQRWEGVVTFAPETIGLNQKVEFRLYKDDEVEQYVNPLYIWVDVIEY